MRYDVTVQYTDEAEVVGKYPFGMLKEVGDMLVLVGVYLQPVNVMNAAYAYAKRHGVKIACRRAPDRKVYCLREK